METKDIGKKFGYSTPCVSTMRRRYAPHTIGVRKWEHIDWSLSIPELMEQTGLSKTRLYGARAAYAPDRHCARHPEEVWDAVDWTMPRSVIAYQLGVTVPAVARQYKKRLAAGLIPPRDKADQS